MVPYDLLTCVYLTTFKLIKFLILTYFLILSLLYRNGVKFALDTRTNLALFRSFTASDYVSAQRLR